MGKGTNILIENVGATAVVVLTFAKDTHEVLSRERLADGDSQIFNLFPGQAIEVVEEEE